MIELSYFTINYIQYNVNPNHNAGVFKTLINAAFYCLDNHAGYRVILQTFNSNLL